MNIFRKKVFKYRKSGYKNMLGCNEYFVSKRYEKGYLTTKLLAYSGMRDIKGERICEGSILKLENCSTTFFVYYLNSGVWKIKNRKSKKSYHIDYIKQNKPEVIGNKYFIGL